MPTATNGTNPKVSPAPEVTSTDPSSNTAERLDALAKERDSLRAEVSELRKSLESIQGKHEEDIATLRDELEESQAGKEHAETQYRNLVGKVNTIKSQLGARLKENQVGSYYFRIFMTCYLFSITARDRPGASAYRRIRRARPHPPRSQRVSGKRRRAIAEGK